MALSSWANKFKAAVQNVVNQAVEVVQKAAKVAKVANAITQTIVNFVQGSTASQPVSGTSATPTEQTAPTGSENKGASEKTPVLPDENTLVDLEQTEFTWIPILTDFSDLLNDPMLLADEIEGVNESTVRSIQAALKNEWDLFWSAVSSAGSVAKALHHLFVGIDDISEEEALKLVSNNGNVLIPDSFAATKPHIPGTSDYPHVVGLYPLSWDATAQQQSESELLPVIVILGGSYSDANVYKPNPALDPSGRPADIHDPGPNPVDQIGAWRNALGRDYQPIPGNSEEPTRYGISDYITYVSRTPQEGMNVHGIVVVQYFGSETHPETGEITQTGKEAQADRALFDTIVSFPDTFNPESPESARPVIVIGYSSGADSALLFDMKTDTKPNQYLNITDRVLLGPTFSGSHSSLEGGLQNNEYNVMESILSEGTNIHLVDDSGTFIVESQLGELAEDQAKGGEFIVIDASLYGVREHWDYGANDANYDDDPYNIPFDGTNNNERFINEILRQVGIKN